MIELIYWPMLQGRGEFVRLVLEAADAPYADVARDAGEDGIARVKRWVTGDETGFPPLAPPIVRDGDLVLAQTANICAWLAARHGLAPADETGRALAMQLGLTIADAVADAHDTHHPVDVGAWYHEQRDAALRAARAFRTARLPKYLDYFERVVEHSGGPWLLGATCTWPDLGLMQLASGVEFAFPNAWARHAPRAPRVRALVKAVRALPRIAAYLESDRRMPFGEHGIFRHYPELDPSADDPPADD